MILKIFISRLIGILTLLFFLLLLSPFHAVMANVVTVDYQDEQFSPAKITIYENDVVEWRNQGSSVLQIRSDPHSGHTDYSSLNLSDINVGESGNLQFSTAGTYGYHNENYTFVTGTITVNAGTAPTGAPYPTRTPTPTQAPTAAPRPTATPFPLEGSSSVSASSSDPLAGQETFTPVSSILQAQLGSGGIGGFRSANQQETDNSKSFKDSLKNPTDIVLKITKGDKPLAGAKVALDNGQSIVTNDKGEAIFELFDLGVHAVSIDDNGKKYMKSFTLKLDDNNLQWTIDLTRETKRNVLIWIASSLALSGMIFMMIKHKIGKSSLKKTSLS